MTGDRSALQVAHARPLSRRPPPKEYCFAKDDINLIYFGVDARHPAGRRHVDRLAGADTAGGLLVSAGSMSGGWSMLSFRTREASS
jgi:hypothetical protein